MKDMSHFEKQQEELRDIRERDKQSRETLGKFFFDVAKLVFTTMVLVGGISLITDEPQLKQGVLATIGLILTYIFATIGYKILKR